MRNIGLLGGISWTSTLEYYRLLNSEVNQRRGGLYSSQCAIYSLDFGAIQERGWENAFDLVLDGCRELEKTNVEAIAICCVTAHMFYDRLVHKIKLPILHIVDALAMELLNHGVRKVGLLATRYTLESSFMAERLKVHGIELVRPTDQNDINALQAILRDELGKGLVIERSRSFLVRLGEQLQAEGAQGLVLGCTELPLALQPKSFAMPLFDMTAIHVRALADYQLAPCI